MSRHSTSPSPIEEDGLAAHGLTTGPLVDMFRNGVQWGLRSKRTTEIKYELIPENGLNRLKAVVDIPNFGIKSGDFGGLVQSHKNLSHKGMCWVTQNATVTESAQVHDNAYVAGTTQIFGNAVICGNSRVIGNSQVLDQAQVSETGTVKNAIIGGTAHVCRTMYVQWDIDKSPIAIILPDSYTVTLDSVNGKISIGDQYFSFDEIEDVICFWKKLLTENRIADRLMAINFLKTVYIQSTLR